MSDKKEIEPDTQTEVDKMLELFQTLVFTFIVVLVIFRLIGCAELYNVMEHSR